MTGKDKIFTIISLLLTLGMTIYEAYSLGFTVIYNISNGYHLAIGSFGIEMLRFVSLVLLLLSILMQKAKWRLPAFIGIMVVSFAFIAKILLNVSRGYFKLQDNLGYLIAESVLAFAALLIIISWKRCNVLFMVLILICAAVAIAISPYYIFANLPILVVGILMNLVSTEKLL